MRILKAQGYQPYEARITVHGAEWDNFQLINTASTQGMIDVARLEDCDI